MQFREFTALIVLLVFGASATELGTTAGAWLKPAAAKKSSTCLRHASNCSCPKACIVPKPEMNASCHGSAASKLAGTPEPSSTASCFMKSGCEPKDAATQARSTLKDFWFRPLEALHCSVQVFQVTDSSTEHPRVGFSPLPFHPPRNILT